MTTIRAAIADGAKPWDLHRPGHVFPLRAQTDGVLVRRGHTEASIDLARLAGYKPAGTVKLLTTMAPWHARKSLRLPENLAIPLLPSKI